MKKRRSFFVPDLTPRDRPELGGVRFRYVFVAESPHVNEIRPERMKERRPLCGASGKVWWNALSEILEGRGNDDLSLGHLLAFCRKHRIAVMNAVQLPLDEGITRHFKDADPLKTLRFSKQTGPRHYKRPSPQREKAVADLRERLLDPVLRGARVVALGNDADWFVRQALGQALRTEDEQIAEGVCKIAHPSAWWRKGGFFGRVSRERLRELLLSDI